MAIEYFVGRRGLLGFLKYITGTDGVSRGGVIPAYVRTDSTGAESPAGTLTAPIYAGASADQDPIFDHTNGTKTSVTTSATIITPPAACKYLRISSDVDIYVNTAGSTAVDDGTSIRIVASVPEIIPVVAATAVKALSSSGTAVVRCTPLKVR